MAKQIEGVYDRVLECAKKEFLEKGFADASLRVIAREANTSTGSIYTRFKDKDGLFRALVDPVVLEIKAMADEIQDRFDQQDPKTQEENMRDFSIENHKGLMNYVYDQKDTFLLLINCAHGSSYECFMDELVEIEECSTIGYLQNIGRADMLENPVTRDFIHILSTSYCYGLFEPLLHNMSRERAHEFDVMFTIYHTAGFESILNGK